MNQHIADAADRAEERAARSRNRLNEGMADVAELSQEMADAGLIDQENADETARIARAVTEKLGQVPETAKKFANDQLKAIIERVERLEEEKKSNRRRHPRRVRGSQRQRLRCEGAAHDHPVAKAGCQRARRTGNDSRNLHARAGDAVIP